jgi:PAS domain S-box-containing protein
MNSNRPSNWHESLQETTDLRQPQWINSGSERLQLEAFQSLQENRVDLEWFRTLYDSVPCICFTLNSTGDVLSINQFGATYLGYDALELVQKSVASVFYWEDQAKCPEKLTEFKQQPTQTNAWSTRLVCKNGNIIWVKALARLVPGTESNPIIIMVCEDITATKQIEKTLRESEELHRSTLEHISDTVFITDNIGAFTFICPNVAVIFGYSLSEVREMGNIAKLLGEHLFDWQALETSREICNIEQEITDKAGRRRTLLVNVKRVSIQGGTVLYSCRDISDLTDLKRTQETLRESEERFRATFEQAAVGISHCDLNGQFLRVNQKFCEIIGYTQEELITGTFRDITFPDDFVVNLDYARSLLAGEIGHYKMKKRYIRKDGAIVWGHQTVSLVREPSGEPKYFVVVVEDISDRILAEETLQESEERFRTMANSAPVLLWVSGSDGLCTFFNQSWLNFTGRTLEQEMGNGWAQAVHPEDLQYCMETYLSAFNARQDFTMEYRLKRADGEYRWILDTGTSRFTSSGSFVGYIGSCVDITERKIAEEALRQQFLKERLVGATLGRIHQSLNLEEILHTTVAEVRQFLACDRVLIFRIDPDGSGVVVVESVGSDWIPMSGTIINDCYFAQSYIKLYQQGRVQAVEDIYAAGLAQCHVDLLAKFQARANLVVPIVHEEKLWGLLVAQQCSQIRKWQPLEIDLLKSLSTQAAIAIHQSELYQQAQTEIAQRQQVEAALRQQFQRERLIGAITQRIRQSLNLEEILERTVAEVRQVLASDRVVIFRFEPDWSGNVVVESVDSSWPSILGTNIYDPCFQKEYILPYQQGRVKAIEDIYTQNLNQCHLDLLARFQVRANLVVPILKGEQLWGLLIAHHCSKPRQWQQFETDLLCSLASQVAIAIQQSQLYEQAQSRAKREQAINQLSSAIRSSLDLNTIFSTAVREIGSLLQLDRAEIVQYLPERKLWLQVSEYSKDPDLPVVGREIPDENNPITERLKRLEIVRIDDTDTFEDEINKRLAQALPGAWLLVPLHFSNQVWGSITLGRDIRPYHWQESEVELICAVADQVAIAIQQSQLYEQAQSHAKREQAINQLTQAIRSSLDLNTIFSTAVNKIGELLQVDRAQIVQYLPERNLWLHISEYRKSSGLPVALGREIPDENNPIAERLKRLEIVQIDDANTCEDEINKEFAQTFPGAWLLVPVQFGDQVWGSITLARDIHPYHWQESEVEIIFAVADQVAIAIQQAELYKQSRSATATALTKAQQLEQTLEKLQRTQSQLVQSEKMSSLGQLVAGVAHEINNPINFISANLSYASEYTQDILGLLQLYQQQYPNPTPEISEEIAEIELDFLIEDLTKLLNSMKVGAQRICEIVRSLRIFSRLAEAEMKAVDIHEGLDSTLVILQHRLKAQSGHPGIEVIKEYGNLPKVECYAGQLNQVFMNLLTNAIDAIDEQNRTREALAKRDEVQLSRSPKELPKDRESPEQIQANPSTIRVRTEVLDNHQVAIRIADNGLGMTEGVKARLFDPFFTTKPVGVGTGLGLSISYQIVVEKHGGQLYCFSEMGKGTEFVIQIPLHQGGKEPPAVMI